jgi:hypothetical protein
MALTANPRQLFVLQLLPKVAQYYGCPRLVMILNGIYEDAKKAASDRQWIALSRRAIGLISLTSISLASQGRLDDPSIKWAEKVGVDDLFTDIPLSESILPALFWL